LIRSKSLNQFVVRRRQAAEIRRQHALRQRHQSLAKKIGFVALFFALPAALVACVLGLVQVPNSVVVLFGMPGGSSGGCVGGTVVSDAFAASSAKLEV
jgi:hypothetical protein